MQQVRDGVGSVASGGASATADDTICMMSHNS